MFYKLKTVAGYLRGLLVLRGIRMWLPFLICLAVYSNIIEEKCL